MTALESIKNGSDSSTNQNALSDCYNSIPLEDRGNLMKNWNDGTVKANAALESQNILPKFSIDFDSLDNKNSEKSSHEKQPESSKDRAVKEPTAAERKQSSDAPKSSPDESTAGSRPVNREIFKRLVPADESTEGSKPVNREKMRQR